MKWGVIILVLLLKVTVPQIWMQTLKNFKNFLFLNKAIDIQVYKNYIYCDSFSARHSASWTPNPMANPVSFTLSFTSSLLYYFETNSRHHIILAINISILISKIQQLSFQNKHNTIITSKTINDQSLKSSNIQSIFKFPKSQMCHDLLFFKN